MLQEIAGIVFESTSATGKHYRPAAANHFLFNKGILENFAGSLAAEYSRCVDLAKGGHPYTSPMVIEDTARKKPDQYSAALQEQQRLDLERGLEYARRKFCLGTRN